MVSDDFTDYGQNWMRYGHALLSEELQDDPERAERLKEEWPEKYYSFEWTPDDPNK